MGPTADLDALGRRKISSLSLPGIGIVSILTELIHLLRLIASSHINLKMHENIRA
jgi:hypothetical protein